MKTSFTSLVLACLCFAQILHAQNTLAGQILDAKKEKLPGVSIRLYHFADRAYVEGTASDTDGKFSMSNLAAGKYYLKVSFIGFSTHTSEPIDLTSGQKNLMPIVLQDSINQMEGVTVVDKKPWLKQDIDRISMDVINSPVAAGSSALDALARIPGVSIDRQNNALSIVGKSGVQLMINGKIKYVPAATLVQMLEGMSADNIVKIEVIYIPPANLDAGGNAGYINIVLKSRLNDGFNGAFTLAGGYGRGAVGSAATNFNLRQDKLNLFGDYSWTHAAQDQHSNFFRSNPYQGQIATTKIYTRRDPVANNQFARLGADYQLTKKTLLGVLFSGYYNDQKIKAINTSQLGFNGSIDTLIRINMRETHILSHLAGNFNVQHQLNDDASINVDLDYLHYVDQNPSSYVNNYADGQGNGLFVSEIQSRKNTPINILVGKMDYLRKWGKNIRMEAGIKAVHSTFTNNVGVDYLKNANWSTDPDLTAKFDLVESIAAAYSSWDIQASDKTSLKLGLRYEFTDSNLGSEEQANIVDRRYGNWFPSFFINHKLTDKNAINLAYSRRIARPTFNEMAPFVIFNDPNNFFSGNAALQPALANNISVGYRHKSIFLMLQYTHEDSSVARFQNRIDVVRNRSIVVSENMRSQKTANLSLNFPLKVSDNWNIQFNVYGNWQQSNTWYNGQLYHIAQTYYGFNTNQQIKISKRLSTEVNAWFRSKSLLFGTYTIKANYGVTAGMQYKLGKKEDLLSFSVSDIFNSVAGVLSRKLETEGINLWGRVDFSQTTFKLSFRHNFGNAGVKPTPQRVQTEEKARVQ